MSDDLGVKEWKVDAVNSQQTTFNKIGDRDWDTISFREYTHLKDKIAFALISKSYAVCSEEEVKIVDQTLNKVRELSGCNEQIKLGYVYINILTKSDKSSNVVPLLRTCKYYGEEIFFVEPQPGRVYRGWQDYIETNRLPKSYMCYPKDGFYRAVEGRVRLEYGHSPSCNIMFSILDGVGGAVGLASGGLLAASVFFPIITPVVLGAVAATGVSTAYTTTRAVTSLVDRSVHHESIGLDNPASIAIWVNMVSNIVSGAMVGGAALVPRLVASGLVTSRITAAVFEVLSYASLAVNGFGVVALIANIVIKYINDTLTIEDLEYFISACTFVGNIVLTTTVAHKVIQTLSKQPSRLVRLLCMTSNTTFECVKSVVGAARMSFNAILNLISGTQIGVALRYFGMTSTAYIHERVTSAIAKFKRGRITIIELCKDLYLSLYSHLGHFIEEVQEAVRQLEKYFNKSLPFIEINGNRLFRNSSKAIPVEIASSTNDCLSSIHINDDLATEDCSRAMLGLATDIATEVDCYNDREFISLCSIINPRISSRCAAKLGALEAENKFVATDTKKDVFEQVVNEIRQNSDQIKREFYTKTKSTISQMNKIFHQPLSIINQTEIYGFETSYEFRSFNQFIYDAACELLKNDNIFKEGEFYLRDCVFVVRIKKDDSWLIFHWESQKKDNRVIGLAILTDQNPLSVEDDFNF